MAGEIDVLHCLWNGETGGAERALYLLVREQQADPELSPALVYGQARGPYADAIRELGVPVIDLGLRHSRQVSRIPAIARAMRDRGLHHFHSPELLMMAASARCDATRVYTHRGGVTEYSTRKRLRHAIAGRMLASYDGLSGNTSHGADSAATIYRIPRDRFAVTYNGLEFDLLEPRRSRAEVREELGVDIAAPVLGTAAHLRSWKRIDRLIRATARPGSELTLMIVGDGEDRPRLEALSSQLGAGDRVVFTGVKRHVGDYLAAMDVFCLPSTALESFGNAAVEAMALGIPTIVASDGGGLLEHVDDGETGYVVGNDDELLRRVEELIAEPVLRRRIGASGRDYVRAKYTPERANDRYKELYGAALSRRATATARITSSGSSR